MDPEFSSLSVTNFRLMPYMLEEFLRAFWTECGRQTIQAPQSIEDEFQCGNIRGQALITPAFAFENNGLNVTTRSNILQHNWIYLNLR